MSLAQDAAVRSSITPIPGTRFLNNIFSRFEKIEYISFSSFVMFKTATKNILISLLLFRINILLMSFDFELWISYQIGANSESLRI